VIIEGTFPIDDFNERFNTTLPDEDYHTMAGFVFGLLGRQPEGKVTRSCTTACASTCSRWRARASQARGDVRAAARAARPRRCRARGARGRALRRRLLNRRLTRSRLLSPRNLRPGKEPHESHHACARGRAGGSRRCCSRCGSAVCGDGDHRHRDDEGVQVRAVQAKVPHGKVTFKLTNKGKIPHDFSIAGKKSKLLAAGKTGTLIVTLKKGKASYKCTVDSHAKLGMKGVLTVT